MRLKAQQDGGGGDLVTGSTASGLAPVPPAVPANTPSGMGSGSWSGGAGLHGLGAGAVTPGGSGMGSGGVATPGRVDKVTDAFASLDLGGQGAAAGGVGGVVGGGAFAGSGGSVLSPGSRGMGFMAGGTVGTVHGAGGGVANLGMGTGQRGQPYMHMQRPQQPLGGVMAPGMMGLGGVGGGGSERQTGMMGGGTSAQGARGNSMGT